MCSEVSPQFWFTQSPKCLRGSQIRRKSGNLLKLERSCVLIFVILKQIFNLFHKFRYFFYYCTHFRFKDKVLWMRLKPFGFSSSLSIPAHTTGIIKVFNMRPETALSASLVITMFTQKNAFSIGHIFILCNPILLHCIALVTLEHIIMF